MNGSAQSVQGQQEDVVSRRSSLPSSTWQAAYYSITSEPVEPNAKARFSDGVVASQALKESPASRAKLVGARSCQYVA